MVGIGFSYPQVAKYSATGNTVTYSGGMSLGRGVSLSLEVDSASDNRFFANNRVVESEDGIFVSGTLTITVDGLENEAATLIFGLPEPKEVTVDGVTDSPVSMQGYGDSMSPPYVGIGGVWMTQKEGVISYFPIVFPKVKFSIPSFEMTTKEDQIDWQTQELEAIVMRDDTSDPQWRYISTKGLATEAEALAVVNKMLSITEE